jgi:ubiquinone/menaquinone biosynthesis C-methylase UbiE
MRRVGERTDPGLPGVVEPFSFVSAALLGHLARELALAPGETLVDLGCGRGGPGLWLAQLTGASLVGVDFSAVAVGQASRRAGSFGLQGGPRFVVGDLAATGLADAVADAVVSVDALHFAADVPAAGREVLRFLRPRRRLVLTGWQPKTAGEPRLPGRLRVDWAAALGSAGLAEVAVEARPEWHELFTRVYEVALELDAAGDEALAALQGEARQHLPLAGLVDRVVVTAIRPVPGRGG